MKDFKLFIGLNNKTNIIYQLNYNIIVPLIAFFRQDVYQKIDG